MLYAIARLPSPSINDCELTYLSRVIISYDLAVLQHRHYCSILRSQGVRVVTLTSNTAYPDCHFIEDTALVLDEITIICSPGPVSRRNEIFAVEQELLKYGPVQRITFPAILEGGDVLRLDRTLFVGQSERSNEQGVDLLQQLVSPYGYHVVPVPIDDALHLQSACTALSENTILLNPAWIDPNVFAGYEIIEIATCEPFAANTLRLPQSILMNETCPQTINRVRDSGFSVVPVDISEFSKAEGGLSCLSIIFSTDRSDTG